MGGAFQYPEEQYFVWRYPFYQATQARLVSSSNPKGDVKINDLELGALLIQILLFSPRMALLEHIHTYVDNKAVQGWANRGSVSIASSIGLILRGLALVARRQQIHAYVRFVLGEDNKMADAMSPLTHLPYRQFISHFRSHFPQRKPWHLPPLQSNYRRKITTMLLNKQSPRVSRPLSSRNMLLPGSNGGASAAGCKYPKTSRTLRTPFPSSNLSPNASVPDFYPCKGNPYRINQRSNISA